MNSRNFSETALMEFSLFLPCMFSPAEYNAAKSLGEAAKRYSRHFFLHVQSCCALCGEKIRRNSRIMDGALAIFFVAFSGLLCTLVPFCPTGT